ncbi:TetR/AcrR family transcriptional regulator [Corynebacterium sp.]|uniref:TetR/AcrR family transcriptional regulator n=1 Tax=Corynebacterium sp. TaxID=1720 RepID=UPI002A90BB3F|nr:TetR/AcrR family transcriptional regulator [Corynebacterium sp.]MDY5785571.1 TetR/AcrR family transcriptional regulator [Corynebacterium sp.]
MAGTHSEPQRPGHPTEVDEAVKTALNVFARDGFEAARLQDLSAESGMSKRMLHYHFGDKNGLYRAAFELAIRQLTPPPEVLSRTYAVPVEGMRRFIDALFHRFLQHPAAVRLVLKENLDPALPHGDASKVPELSDTTLHIERLLLLGQDSGAFRPDVSADDILLMLCSLCALRASQAHTALGLTRVDLSTQRNTEGMRRMTIDTVLAFLTSNIPPSGYGSYVEPTAAPLPVDDTDDVYDFDVDIY